MWGWFYDKYSSSIMGSSSLATNNWATLSYRILRTIIVLRLDITSRLKTLRHWVYMLSRYMLFNFNYFIQRRTLTHIWHIITHSFFEGGSYDHLSSLFLSLGCFVFITYQIQCNNAIFVYQQHKSLTYLSTKQISFY